ncbi:hypothetical protein SAMN05421543_12436 [Alicyclobacillus macrosporangiidus]|uniref:Uncharacterized protein n=1 Tax=Alicyclobacillus macrosporangiidus TaxID=392015 RepID=A0A1I7L3U3_9BACL|nr:hypothetical protein SAMN05421543_12436 [Alicyclobacillus macrosporangiidus]
MAFLLYSDHGDPGPGPDAVAQCEPSPYTNAIVYTMVNPADHGFLLVVPQIVLGMNVGNETELNKNMIKIPVVVQQ